MKCHLDVVILRSFHYYHWMPQVNLNLHVTFSFSLKLFHGCSIRCNLKTVPFLLYIKTHPFISGFWQRWPAIEMLTFSKMSAWHQNIFKTRREHVFQEPLSEKTITKVVFMFLWKFKNPSTWNRKLKRVTCTINVKFPIHSCCRGKLVTPQIKYFTVILIPLHRNEAVCQLYPSWFSNNSEQFYSLAGWPDAWLIPQPEGQLA